MQQPTAMGGLCARRVARVTYPASTICAPDSTSPTTPTICPRAPHFDAEGYGVYVSPSGKARRRPWAEGV
eukprot:11227302-Lingulodinium_polyedra.AAC.1